MAIRYLNTSRNSHGPARVSVSRFLRDTVLCLALVCNSQHEAGSHSLDWVVAILHDLGGISEEANELGSYHVCDIVTDVMREVCLGT